MSAVYRRDLFSFFRGAMGYAFFAIFFFIEGYVFTSSNIFGGSGSLDSVFDAAGIFMIVVIPLITSHLYVDGHDINTEQLLYVSPLGVSTAKLAAVMTVSAGAVLSTWIYVGVLAVFGEPHIAEVLLSQLGLLLLICTVTSLTIFILSIAHRRMQAFVMIYTILLLFFVANSLVQSSSEPVYESLGHILALFSCYNKLRSGIISPSDVVYMLTFSGVMVSLTCMMIERRREKGV